MKKTKSRFMVILVMLLALTLITLGCSAPAKTATEATPKPTAEKPAVQYKDGVYEGVGQGKEGEVKVSVKITDNKIAEVKVIAHHETKDIGTIAVDELPGEIIKKQSTQVDSVSGATLTSKAILDGVNNALEKAK